MANITSRESVANPRPVIAYCATPADAATLVREILNDAAGRHVAIDIETAPIEAEAARLKVLVARQAETRGRLKAAARCNASPAEVAALKAEAKLASATVKYTQSAALDPDRGRVRLVQLYGGGRRVAVIDGFRTGEKVLLNLLDGVDAVAHNAAFELAHLNAIGVELGEVHCTMQAARLTLGERAMSLAAAAEAHLGVKLDKEEQISDWAAPSLSLAQLEYAAADVVTTWRLGQRILPALGPQTRAYEIQIGAVPAAMRMETRGILLDLAAHAKFIEAQRANRIVTCAAYKTACAVMNLPALAAKIPETPAEKQATLQTLLTSEELAKWRRTPRSGALSTRRSDLRRAAHYPPIKALAELSRIDKILTAFGSTVTVMVSPVTGRLHPHYLIAATASGRASCARPNLQQAPRAKDFRALFIAKDGSVLIGGDYSSMELRAVAHISGERRMTLALRNGEDLHRITASLLTGKPLEEVTDEERRGAKAVNFGSVFGIGVNGLIAAAWEQYELALSVNEARALLDAFAKAYPDFIRWRSVHAAQCQAQGRIVIGKDAKHGVGRIYPLSRLPAGKSVYTRSCNLPVQGACADASMLALAAVDQALFDAGVDGGPVAWLHDEIVLEVKQDDAERAAGLLQQAMTGAFAETFPGAPLNGLVAVRTGATWAKIKG
jgi:DNA polymerase-1